MKRLTSGKKSGKGCVYPPDIKSFALTLQLYSSKAYNFVWKTFNLALPCPAQIRKWYTKVPAEPGFTEPSFEAICCKVTNEEKLGKKVICALMLDEMSIKKHIAWDGAKFRGYVDIGNGSEGDDSSSLATDVLFFMAFAVNSIWKIPVAYFFVDGLTGVERANLIKICLQRLHDTGAQVVSLTFYGPSCHFSMLAELGANLDINNLLFDVLNSRNPFAKGYKSALRVGNKHCWSPFLEEAYKYILGLKTSSGQQIAIHGDHLELFFGAIRSSGGFNNNPTTQQFTATYKRLPLRSSIHAGVGNCIKQDATETLHAFEGRCTQLDGVNVTNVAMARKYDLLERQPEQIDHDYSDMPNFSLLSEYKEAVIGYMAGYVAIMVSKQMFCEVCCKALGSKSNNTECAFLKMKDRGGLFKPSASVIDVCQETEKTFQRMIVTTGGELPRAKGIADAITFSVLHNLDLRKIFCSLDDHMFDCAVEDNHVLALIKTITKCYCKLIWLPGLSLAAQQHDEKLDPAFCFRSVEMPVRCPITVEYFGDITFQDERKDCYINMWLDGDEKFIEDNNCVTKFDFLRCWISGKETFIPESEYPKKRIFDFEFEPKHSLASLNLTASFVIGPHEALFLHEFLYEDDQ
eukprot:gene20811-22854_t